MRTNAEAFTEDSRDLVKVTRSSPKVFRESQHDENGSIFAVILAGQGHQRDGEAHCAHVAEHMVFHNPIGGELSLQEWIRTLKSTPASQYNGWTGWDHTQFEVSVPDQHITQRPQVGLKAGVWISPGLRPPSPTL